MEVRRRSLSSEYEFRERRTAGRKKRGALPLAMVLSFNDKDVHPDCPNVSNPYHKCGRHCLDKIPTGQNFLDAIRSGGDQEWDKKSEKTGVNPNCPYASNPYHKCAEYCSGKLLEKPQDAGKDKPGVNPKKEVFTTEKEVKPECIYASNPYHVCAEYCVPIVPEKDQPRQSTRLKGSREGEKVLIARHASNPNQECAESCLQIATDRNVADRVKYKGAPKKTNKGSVHLIRNASSHSKVTEYFFEDAPKKEEDMQSKKENEIDHTTQLELSCLCKNASKADHVCDEYCFQSVPEREQYGQVIKLESSKEGENAMSNNIESTAAKPKEESEIIVTVEQVVNLEYKNASNPSDARPEYCSESVPEREQHEQIIRLKSMKEGDKFLNNRHSTGFDPCCKLASNPHHECTEFCFKNTPDRNLAEEAIKPKDKSKIVVAEKGVNLEHKSASNPDCVPAEYGSQCVLEREQHRPKKTKGVSFKIDKSKALPDHKHISNSYHEVIDDCFDYNPPNGVMKPKEERIIVTTEQRVDLVCKYASNPYHECTEYCFQNLPNEDQRRKVLTKSMEKEEAVVPLDRVNPQCKQASNPYHVCAEYCFPTVPEKDRPGQSTRPKGSKEGEKVFSTKHACSPNHEYAESCFQIVDRNIAKGEKPKGAPKKTNKGSLHLNRNASSHNNVTEYFFEDTPKKEHLKEVDMKSKKENEIDLTTQRELSSLCKNASKPYHVCDEYCFLSVPERKQREQVIRLKSSKEGEKAMSNIESTAAKPKEESEIIETVEQIVNLENKNVSNSSNVCPEYCSESVHKKDISERDQHEQIIRLKSTKEGDKFLGNRQITGFDAWCQHASNPHHECTEFCFKNTPDRNLAEEEKMKGVSFKIDKSSALPDHKHISNPYHEVIEDCFDDNPEQRHPNGAMKPKEEGIVVMAERGVDLVCKYASNPYHECTECCFQNLPNEDQGGKAITKSMEKEVAVVPLERVSLQCKLASNPYHVCAEYCFQNVSNGHHPERSMMTSKEKKKVVLSPQVMNLECKYSSNPYHVCAEYCFKNVLERDPPRQTIKKLKEEDAAVLLSERQVSPECKFASNPYHVCAEYCVKNALEGEQQGQVMKLKSLKELKGLVNNKKITSGHPQCEYSSNPYHQCAENCFNKNVPASKIPDRVVKRIERKKEKSYSPRRDDTPKYKNASNSFHRCPDYCSEETSPTNEVVEGSTATIKKKKRNSSKGNRRNHPIVEKISLNSRYMEASKPGQNYVESSERIILHDGTEKSSMDSKYAGTNHNFNLNNGISMFMQYETKDLQSAKMVDIKNPKEPTDVPPLHIDASDLFNEWANYCSQTKVAEDEIVKQEKKVGIGELTTRNGKANSLLKDYDAANLEKVQATVGIPRSSLPILLLFLLGFLLALLHWARVIHSLVISSEKHEEPERMKHERHLDPKCKKVSDPCHKFSHYRFPGVDDEIQ